jgi:hypothetical protein
MSDGSPSGSPWDGASPVPDGNIAPSGDASACRPGDVETYQPGIYRSATAAWQGVCTRALIDGFYTACFDLSKATPATCRAFVSDPNAAGCSQCILTSDQAPHYGPLIDHTIDHTSFVTTNVAGCIELTDPKGRSCSKSLQALGGCEIAACEANCPVNDGPSLAAYSACVAAADESGCQSYAATAASCVDAEVDSGLVADCLIPTFAEFYAAVVPLFCGPPPADGGAPPYDASFDATLEAGPDAQADARGDAPSSDARFDAKTDALADAPADAPSEAASDAPAEASSSSGD